MKYHLTDYLHFARMYARNRRRQRVWGKLYEAAVRSQTFKLPAATVVQLIPTEACNLRCPFCNQWGENGYFFDGIRHVEHMNEDSLIRLMRSLSPRDSLISVHGGEPFVYKHIDTLLELLREQQFDVIFSTNGTLLESHLTPLAKVRNLIFLLSIDGDEKAHDKVRGKGTFRQARESMAALFELRRQLGLPLPAADTGYAHTSDQVALVQLSAEQLLGYYDAVHARTAQFLETVTDDGLDRIVDKRWNPPVTLGVRLVSVIDDCAQHAGQAAYVKGLVS